MAPTRGTLFSYDPYDYENDVIPRASAIKQFLHFTFNMFLLIVVLLLLGITEISPLKHSSPAVASSVTTVTSTPHAELFIWPVSGTVTSRMILDRLGIDITQPADKSIKASAAGRVEFAGCSDNEYRCYIILNHGNGYKTLYGHMSYLFKQPREEVKQGDTLGLVDSEFRMEFQYNNVYIDPLSLLP